MAGRVTPALFAASLALAGCGPDATPAPAPTARPSATASATPAPEPSEVPEPEPSAEPSRIAGATFAPRDECSSAPGFTAFRKSLVSSIKARDVEALAALAAPDITLDYGGGSGTEELRKRLADPDRKLWSELDGIMPLGCAVEGGLAAMPWVFWNVPEQVDSYSAMLVTGEDAELLDASDQKGKGRSKALGQIGWRIVGIDPLKYDPKASMTQVTLETGEKGWVESRRLRSLLDYRIIAEPKDGSWQITAFIAGD